MIAVDTNVLLRYVVGDDPAQFRVASRLINSARDSGTAVYVALPVLCEFVWTLTSVYKLPRLVVLNAVHEIATSRTYVVERGEQVKWALLKAQDSSAGFTDILIGEIANVEGCKATYTFDRKLARYQGFAALK